MNSAPIETSGTSRARLYSRTVDGEEQVWTIKDGTTIIGRDLNCDIVLLGTLVSRRHAQIQSDGNAYCLTDLGSVNRTYLNGAAVDCEANLHHNDRIEVGGFMLEFSLQPVQEAIPESKLPEELTLVMPEPAELASLSIFSGPQKGAVFVLKLETAIIGRAGGTQSWDIVLTDRAISRPHAQVQRTGQGFVLSDLDSANGTRVNGQQLTAPRLLSDGDAVLIGETVLIYHRGAG